MRILIDTHVLIWYLNGDDNLSQKLVRIIEDETNIIVISTARLWEIAIKLSSGKVGFEIALSEIEKYINEKDVELLNIDFQSLTVLAQLPYHHRDPFDRLLIAQAISQNASIISADRHFTTYAVDVIW